jgi:general secretion pathway protein D
LRESVQKVPGLGSIPLLGNLFKNRSTKVMKRNLMVFLHPLILRDAARESAVSASRYNSMRQRQIDVREKASGLTPREAMPMLPELQQYLSAPVSEDGVAE